MKGVSKAVASIPTAPNPSVKNGEPAVGYIMIMGEPLISNSCLAIALGTK
jgi:hypothetical protein